MAAELSTPRFSCRRLDDCRWLTCLLATVAGVGVGCGRSGLNGILVQDGNGGSTPAAGETTASSGGHAGRASPCSPNPCLNRGECNEGVGDFVCRCPPDRTGKTCALLRFEGLGGRSNCDRSFFSASDVSADGRVVVGACTPMIPFRWTAEAGFEEVGFSGTVSGTNRDGSRIVGTTDSNAAVLFDWRTKTQVLLPAEGSSRANAISSDGRVVVGEAGTKLRPCRWIDAGQPEFLDLPVSFDRAWANDVSSDGSVVVGTISLSSYPTFYPEIAYRYSAPSRGMTEIPSGHSRDLAVSGDGSVVVGWSYDPNVPVERAFRWTPATGTIDLGCPDGLSGAHAVGTNADGTVVAMQGYNYPDVEPFDRAMIWDHKHGLRFVSKILTAFGVAMDGWILRTVVAISADGHVVVGQGTNPAGATEPWIARLDP